MTIGAAVTNMSPIDRLLAIEEIKQLKARYFRCVDTKDWEGLAAVFAPDATFDRRGAANVRDPWTSEWSPPLPADSDIRAGRAAIICMIRDAVEHLHTVHHGHTPEIDVIDEVTARGIWAMEDELHDRGLRLVLRGRGHYHETYARLPTGWVIKSSRISRLALTRSDGTSDAGARP